MNKFKEHNITIITETEEQRVIENRQRYFWNNKPIRFDIGKDIVRYCNLFNVRCDVEDTKKDNTTVSVHTYKTDKDWQEIVKDIIRIDNERNKQNE
jgi:hypothetical protein